MSVIIEESRASEIGGFILIISLIGFLVWVVVSFGDFSNFTINTYGCAEKANKLSKESEDLLATSLAMGCDREYADSTLLTKCAEIRGQTIHIVKQWKELPCTDDSLAPKY